MNVIIILLLCIQTITFATKAQLKMEVTYGVLQSIDNYKSRVVASEKQPSVNVEEVSQKPFSHPGVRGRFALSVQLHDRLSAIVQTGANLRIGDYLWGYIHTYATIPLQGGLIYALIKSNPYTLSVQGYSGTNIFCIYNPLARQQTGSLHNAELSFRWGSENQSKSLLIKAGYELETDHETYFFRINSPFLHDENFTYKVKRHQVYFAVGMAL